MIQGGHGAIDLNRKQLQALAKRHHIAANLASVEIVRKRFTLHAFLVRVLNKEVKEKKEKKNPTTTKSIMRTRA